MVHRPIFLGISMGVDPKKPSLDISITINDGFFSLGTKNYSFPIISDDDQCSTPSHTSPLICHSPNTNSFDYLDQEELKGMYIDLKRKIVLSPYFTTVLDKYNEQNKIVENKIISKINIKDSNNTNQSISYQVISKLPPTIEREEAKNECVIYDNILTLDSFDDEIVSVFSDVLVVTIDKWLYEYTKDNTVKIVGTGLPANILANSFLSDKIKSMLWKKYDILPCFFSGNYTLLDQQSETLARKCASLIGHENLPDLTITDCNKVLVDSGNIWYCSLSDYIETIGEKGSLLIKDLQKEAESINKNQIKISFFSSTAQGGGVALMRHSLIRFFQMLGIDASWYVCTPNSAVFNITKKKIHNILQNVSQNAQKKKEVKKDAKEAENFENNQLQSKNNISLENNKNNIDTTWLTNENKDKIDNWLNTNYNSHWKKVIANSSVVVLDDHQVARLASVIRKDSPDMLIIYRSHIQILSKLMTIEKTTAIDNVWEFLWESIQFADYFVSHPIETSIPKNVSVDKVIFQPAGTDQLDGLNKSLSKSTNAYYQNVFNRLCMDNNENPVNFYKKYIVQIARFDPSKGINDLLDAYYELFLIFKNASNNQKTNEIFDIGLVICGHGSIDDPEATTIYNEINEKINCEKFQEIRHLITKISLPPSDQLLNMIQRNAYVSCQLSTSEGFEVKITESLMKNVPVIVYNVGGLPLQVKDNINGFIVKKGQTKQVAEKLYELLTNESLYEKIKKGINPKDFIGITIPFQAFFWLKMFKKEEKKPMRYYDELIKKYL